MLERESTIVGDFIRLLLAARSLMPAYGRLCEYVASFSITNSVYAPRGFVKGHFEVFW